MNVSEELRQLAAVQRVLAQCGTPHPDPLYLANALERLAVGARRMEDALDDLVADAMENERLRMERRGVCTGNVIAGPWVLGAGAAV